MFGKRKGRRGGEPFRFRVSDAVEMPYRGYLLRLRLVDGAPALDDLKRGARLRLVAPDARERVIEIADHAVTAGRPTQERLERTRELDIVVAREEAGIDGTPVGIGWTASGPVTDTERGDG